MLSTRQSVRHEALNLFQSHLTLGGQSLNVSIKGGEGVRNFPRLVTSILHSHNGNLLFTKH
jgi:hypothetical protein